MNDTLPRRISDLFIANHASNPTSTPPSDQSSNLTLSPTANPASEQPLTPPSDPPSNPAPIPTPNLTSNCSKPRYKSLTLRDRFLDIFPPGLESNSSSTPTPYRFTAHYLNDVFQRNRGNQNAARIVVTSAWYGKQIKAAKHEFIVIHVEDPAIPGLKNCMAIDRNKDDHTAKLEKASSSSLASDAFRVAYDGDLERLLQESRLTRYLELEELSFPGEPLSLQRLVVLVNHISTGHRRYNPMDANCYWFTGLIWECMLNMCPGVDRKVITSGRKGRILCVRHVPNPIQVRNVLRAVQEEIKMFDSELSSPNYPTNTPEEDAAATASLANAETDMAESRN